MAQDKNIGQPIFSLTLTRLMRERSLTQEGIAAASSVSQATVNGWLSGSIPRADALMRLARQLGVTMEFLLMGADPKAPVHRELPPARASPEARNLVNELLRIARALESELKK